MFNWVCPRCGKDVPPSKTECPYCPPVAQEPVAPVAPAPPGYPPQYQAPQYQTPQYQPQEPPPPSPPSQQWQPAPPPPQPQPTWAPPPPPPSWQAAPPPPAPVAQPQSWQQPSNPQGPPPQWAAPPQNQPQHQPPHHQPPPAWAPPAERAGQPTWLIGLGFAVAFIAAFAAIYYGIQHFGGHTNVQEKVGLENPANPSQQKVSNPLQKYVEVVGIRMIADNKKPAARFIVVNHSNSEISGLEANVTLWASTSRSEEDSVGSFTFKLPNLGANSSKELTEGLKTKLKPYELPDWQNATAEIQITSPQP